MDPLWLVVIFVSVVLGVAAFFAVRVKWAAQHKPAAKFEEKRLEELAHGAGWLEREKLERGHLEPEEGPVT